MNNENIITALYAIIGKKTVEIEALTNSIKLLQKENKELTENATKSNKKSS